MLDSKVTNIKNIKTENLPYIITWIIYYAWVIVFTTWWTASPLTDEVYGTDSRVILHSLNLVSSAICVFFMKKEWFKKFAIVGGILVIISSILFTYTMHANLLQLHSVITIVLALSLGVVNAGILIPFVYTLNNTEKFYSVVGTNVLITILVLLQELNILDTSNGIIFSFVMLVLGIVPIYFFKLSDYKKEEKEHKEESAKTVKVIYITLVINCLYVIFCKGVGRAFLTIANETVDINLNVLYYIGAGLGCIIYFLIYHIFKKCNHATWNVIFATFAFSMFVYIVAETIALKMMFSVIVGISSTMGMINMYYILGVIGKKYWNHTYVKASIFFIGVCGGASGTLLGNILTNYNDAGAAVIIAIISILIIIILLAISPLLATTYYKEKWEEDATKTQIDNKNLRKYQRYKLTKREIDVCNLLLENYTNRQIASMLGLTENTVKYYSKRIYKKLDVYSKNEISAKLLEK